MENPAFESGEKYRGDDGNDARKRTWDHKMGLEEEAGKTLEKVELKKVIGFKSCVGMVIGTVIGSGIFISPKGVLLGTGSVGLTLVVWTLCGLFSFAGALAFAELATLIPCSAGQYFYFLEALAPNRKEERLFWGPLVAFLYSWNNNFFARPAGFAVQAITVARYIMRIIYPDCTPQNDILQVRLIATLMISILTCIICRSTKASITITNVLTATKLFALLFIISGGIAEVSQGTNEALKTGFEGTRFSAKGISTAFYSGFWAYLGWDVLNNVVREVKHPQRDIVRSLMVSCTIITIVYLLTNISYFIFLTKDEFLESDAVAVTFGKKLVGPFGGAFVMVCVVCSIVGSCLIGATAAVRLWYAAAREGHMIDIMSYLHIRYMTPFPALIFSCFIAICMVFNATVLEIINYTGFLDNLFMMFTMVVLLMLRKTKKHEHRAIKVPVIVPVFVFCFNLFLVIAPLVDNPDPGYFYVIAFLGVGVLVYIPFVYFKILGPVLTVLNPLKHFIQIVFQVSAPEDHEI